MAALTDSCPKSTPIPKLQYPCLSGGVTLIMATSTAISRSANRRLTFEADTGT
ncbi:hypothetical protein GPSY_3556 [Paraglaciecola psychrophila 170]|nr:hypothetical protein GPSY_3556 [Paraglaciecola psychrophila 170]